MKEIYMKLIGLAVVAAVIICLGLGVYFQQQQIQSLNKEIGSLEGDLKVATQANEYASALEELQGKLSSGFAKVAAENAASLQALQQGVNKQNEDLRKALSTVPCANEPVPDIAICVLQPSKCRGGEGKGDDLGTSGTLTSTKP